MTTEANDTAPADAPDPAAGQDLPASQAEGGAPSMENDAAAAGDPSRDDTVADATVEIEHEGQTYRIPRAVQPLLTLPADLARKSHELAEQALAERARGLDAEREAFARSSDAERQIEHQIAADGRELVTLDWQIQQLEATDFAALQQQDAGRATQVLWQLTQLKGTREAKARALQQRIAERRLQAEQALRLRRDQAQAVLARDIEGWSPELQGRLATYALKELGITPQELGQVEDPRLVKLLHAAWAGAQAVQKLKAAAAPATPPPAPTRTVGGAAPAHRNPQRLTTEEWMRQRTDQLRGRRT